MFTIQVASVPDKDKLIAEIWYGPDLIAELSNEQDEFVLRFYKQSALVFGFDDLLEALNTAKEQLIG